MKAIISTVFLFFTINVIAQQSNRGLVFNNELRVLIGNWQGKTVYTDPKQNNTQVTLETKLTVVDLKDSLRFDFAYTWPDKHVTYDTSFVCIYNKEDKLSYDHEMYDIVSTGRKGMGMIVVGEKQGFDNRLVADLRRVLTFGPGNLKILKESRYMENEFFFIRSRAELTRAPQ
jgi:hypothetical protein